MEDLVNQGLWNEDMKQELMQANGSIQHIQGIPDDIKELYKTVWEMSMKDIIDMSRHRGYFIDQSQSLNLFMEGATMAKLTSMHFYAWKSGLKTGMYYLRTKSAVDAIKFTLDNAKAAKTKTEEADQTSTASEPVGATSTSITGAGVNAQNNPAAAVEPLTPAELKQMLEQSKKSEDDDCLMCGS